MEVSHFTDALSVSFFALLGIWASVVRRHWFLRFATVGGFLLITLLLPAYELVIEFGLQMAIIATGVWLARGRRRWQPRLSLETALLLTVVLAIVFAVIARLPEFGMQMWFRMTGIGAVTACFALLCLWIVFGRSRLWMRIVGGALGVAALVALLHFGSVVSTINFASGRGWKSQVLQQYQWDQVEWWFSWNLKTTAIAVAVMLSALTLARFSGWFNRADEAVPMPTTRRMIAARVGLSAVFVAVAAPLFYILYALLTPPPISKLHLPTPNGYDDFIAAGKLLPIEVRQSIARPVTWQSLTTAELERANHAIAPVVERLAMGLQRQCHVSDPYAVQSIAAIEKEMEALLNCHWALMIRQEYLRRTGTPAEQVDSYLQSSRFSQESTRGAGVDSMEFMTESTNVLGLQGLLGELDADTCRLVARQVDRIDRDREPHEHRQAVQAIVDQHSDWKTHLQHLLTIWSGNVPNEMDYWNYRTIAETRLLIADAALQAFVLDHRRPPDSLAQLAPEYLDAVPVDPFNNAPLKYERTEQTYKVYSVGYNGEDDGGEPESSDASIGDIVFDGPHPPPLWMRLRDATAEGLKALWNAAANAAEPAAE